MTDLPHAVGLNLPVLMLSLLKQGATVDAKAEKGVTPLHGAARRNASEAAEVLLRQGADIQAEYATGWTPLNVAAVQNNASAVAKVLRRYGGRK